MRSIRIAVSFLLIIALTAVVVGLLSAKTRGNRTDSAKEPVSGQEIDATRNVLMCI